MQLFSKCLDDLKFKIPRPILEAVFIRRNFNWRDTHNNIDALIMSAVIRPRIFVDCNLVGGTEATIDLSNVPRERISDYQTVYHIPKIKTQNRSIMSVLNVTYGDPSRISNYGLGATIGNSTMLRAAQGVMNAMGSIPVTSSANAQIIAENTVLVRDTVLLPANMYLRCILANDENFSHIQPKSYRYFSKLVEYAVKAYIYNEYVVYMDSGELEGGQNLGIFKEIISGYADANELYEDYLNNVIQKVSFMNDRESYTRLLKLIIGGNR